MNYNKSAKCLLVFLFFNFLITNSAFAYLDPGTGSMVIQIIIASICGLICTAKMWVKKVLNIFRKNRNEKE